MKRWERGRDDRNLLMCHTNKRREHILDKSRTWVLQSQLNLFISQRADKCSSVRGVRANMRLDTVPQGIADKLNLSQSLSFTSLVFWFVSPLEAKLIAYFALLILRRLIWDLTEVWIFSLIFLQRINLRQNVYKEYTFDDDDDDIWVHIEISFYCRLGKSEHSLRHWDLL